LSQTVIGSLTGYSQGKVSAIMSGSQQVTAPEVCSSASPTAVRMPDQARMAHASPRTTWQPQLISSKLALKVLRS